MRLSLFTQINPLTMIRRALAASGARDEQPRQEEFVQARREAEAEDAEAAKSELISIVSHELRTPLTALQGFSELLLVRECSEEERVLWTTKINEEAKRLAKILDDMLTVSRIERGVVRLKLQPIAIEEAIRDALALFSADSNDHRFIVDVDALGLAVSADRERLTQVIENLVSNAVRYSPGGGTIRIAASESDGHAVVSVSDQGIGIPAEELPKLFSRFHRIDTPDRVAIRGTGLGLYIAQRLVAMQGGTISVESEVGKGSTFTFTMPLARSETRL